MRCRTIGVSGSVGLMLRPLASLTTVSLQPGITPPRSAAPSAATSDEPAQDWPPNWTDSAHEASAGAAGMVAARPNASRRSGRLTGERVAFSRGKPNRTLVQKAQARKKTLAFPFQPGTWTFAAFS